MKRKILSLILVFAMTVSLLTVGTGAVEPTYGDTKGHWAESSIERWSGHGIVQGSNGEFDPNGQLTCAQLATILARLLKLPAAPSAGFSDVAADAWYADAINRCVAAGILNGNGDGTVSPTAPITRERAMVMLGRALGIQPIENPDLSRYGDAAKVAPYAQGYVAAMIEAGIVTGVGGDQIAPQDDINRASTVTILDRAIAIYADKDGATIDAKDGGLILVVAENVKVVNAPEGTTVVAADGATGLNVNDKAVTDDQTYVVPKTEPAKPSGGSSSGGSSGGHSHSYVDGVCSCGAVDPAAAEASINGNYYRTLSDTLLIYAVSGDTVVLNKDLTVDTSIQLPSGNITIDFGTHTITGGTDVYVLQADTTGVNVTLTGTTGGIRVDGSDSGIVKIGDGVTATVSITGGTYNVDPSAYLAADYKATANNGIWAVEKKAYTDYPAGPAEVSQMPSGVEIVNNSDGTFVITLNDETAFYYFTQKFDRAAAFEARKAAWDASTITRYPYEYNLSSLNMWYDAYCNRITVKMGCDIDWDNEAINPFGFGGYEVNFDGCNHIIRNAKIEASTGDIGFFAARVNIKNVTLDNICVSATGCNSAGIVAGAPNSIITGVTVKNSSVTGAKYTGAIAGYDYGNVTDCTVENTVVTGQYKVGGIIGYICGENNEVRTVTGNTLTNVTVKGENLVTGKANFVIGKIVGNWNAINGTCNSNTFSGTTAATGNIGEIESRCTNVTIDP